MHLLTASAQIFLMILQLNLLINRRRAISSHRPTMQRAIWSEQTSEGNVKVDYLKKDCYITHFKYVCIFLKNPIWFQRKKVYLKHKKRSTIKMKNYHPIYLISLFSKISPNIATIRKQRQDQKLFTENQGNCYNRTCRRQST